MVALAVIVGVIVNASVGDRASDLLIPRDVSVDARIIVIGFDTGGDGGTGVVPHLRATFYRDIARLASQSDARAVGFVDFDSITFSDGEGGRSNVVASDAMQTVAVIPLDSTSVATPDGGKIPFMRSYRVDELASEVAGVGIPLARSGGVVRTVPALARAESLADGAIIDPFSAGLSAADRRATIVVPGFGLRLIELGAAAAITRPTTDSVSVGHTQVPLENGYLRVRWSDRLDSPSDPSVVLFDQLPGLPSETFHNAIVLVGSTNPANTAYVDTPVGSLPPVLVYANAINTVLGRHFVRIGPNPAGPLAATLAAVAMIVVPRKRRWLPFVLTLAVCLSWLLAARQLADSGTLIPALTVPVAVLATLALGVARTQLTALAERRQLRLLFAQYVPASIAHQLASSGRGQIASKGERLAVTTLFCDLRGFTPLCTRLEPSRVRQLLDIYYEQLANIVFQANGTVLQFTGDEIFAVFGAPFPTTDHAQAALACAQLMFDQQAQLNALLADEELPGLNYGIGIHSGVVIAAHVGSSVHRQYSVFGDTVNIGSRHCTLAREGQIAVSDATRALLGDIANACKLDGIAIKGLDGSHSMWLIQAGPSDTSGSPELSHPALRDIDLLQPFMMTP